jgi:1-acyl-sn-glycerol-3-phosphate acyltransferase
MPPQQRTPNPFLNSTPSLPLLARLEAILVVLSLLPLLRLAILALSVSLCAIHLLVLSVVFRPRRPRGPPPPPNPARAPPSPPFRAFSALHRALFWPIHVYCRLILLAFGVWRVREVFPPNTPPLYHLLPFGGGYLTRRGAARVIVATHHSFLDAFFVGSRLIPTAVAKAALASVPILGAAMASLGPVLVPRSAEEKQRLPPVLDQIVAKATSLHPIYQPLVVFPEGTTSSCATILSFQIGAFVPGVPVQPLLLHYSCGAGSTLARLLSLVGVRVPSSAHGVDPAMTPDLSSVTSLLRLLLLPSVTLTATYLPVVRPTEAERADPGLYAARVRQAMVLASGRVPVDASDRDALLFSRCSAPERGGRPCSDWVLNTLIRPVGAKEIERLLGTPLRLDVTTCLAVRLWEAAAGQEGSEGAGESESAPDAVAADSGPPNAAGASTRTSLCGFDVIHTPSEGARVAEAGVQAAAPTTAAWSQTTDSGWGSANTSPPPLLASVSLLGSRGSSTTMSPLHLGVPRGGCSSYYSPPFAFPFGGRGKAVAAGLVLAREVETGTTGTGTGTGGLSSSMSSASSVLMTAGSGGLTGMHARVLRGVVRGMGEG